MNCIQLGKRVQNEDIIPEENKKRELDIEYYLNRYALAEYVKRHLYIGDYILLGNAGRNRGINYEELFKISEVHYPNINKLGDFDIIVLKGSDFKGNIVDLLEGKFTYSDSEILYYSFLAERAPEPLKKNFNWGYDDTKELYDEQINYVDYFIHLNKLEDNFDSKLHQLQEISNHNIEMNNKLKQEYMEFLSAQHVQEEILNAAEIERNREVQKELDSIFGKE